MTRTSLYNSFLICTDLYDAEYKQCFVDFDKFLSFVRAHQFEELTVNIPGKSPVVLTDMLDNTYTVPVSMYRLLIDIYTCTLPESVTYTANFETVLSFRNYLLLRPRLLFRLNSLWM